MATLKQDNVNRYDGTVVLPIKCSKQAGDVVKLKGLVEREIDCSQRDPNQMYDPHLGNGIGDAIMDAALDRDDSATCDAGVGTLEDSFYILAEGGGIMTNGSTRYQQEHEENTP